MSKIQIVNNHLLLDIQTNIGLKTCVVDTGCPITFFFDEKVREITIGNDKHVISSFMGAMPRNFTPQEDVEQLISKRIDGFIGADIMQRYGDVLFDLRNEEISFGATDYAPQNIIPMRSMFGLPLFNVSFNGHETLTAFDSGAMYSFVSSSFAQDIALAPAYDTKRDHHPGHGWFDINLHQGDVVVGNTSLGPHTIATSDHYDTILAMIGVSAFIGIDTLRTSTLLLSYSRNEISVE